MYKDRFDKLVEKGVFSETEKEKVYSQMTLVSDDEFIGAVEIETDYKYYVGGDIINDNLCDFVINHCVPPPGMEHMDDTFKTYGMTCCGIGDGWQWFTKDNISKHAIKNGSKPIEEASDEELWKMLAMSSMYWEGNYKEWCERSEQKSNILDRFVDDCERKYFGYDKEGYTIKTINRILDSINTILEEKFKSTK